jgi:hypothetical protein
MQALVPLSFTYTLSMLAYADAQYELFSDRVRNDSSYTAIAVVENGTAKFVHK